MGETYGMPVSMLLLILYIFLDVNYFIRCAFTVVTLRLFQGKHSVLDTTTIYGICTPQDVDIFLRHMNNARFLRELNFASVHYYMLTNMYDMVRERGGTIVQGATSLRYRRFISIFQPYKIQTKLIWWDERAIYLEQQFVTLTDGFVNAIALSKHRFTECNVFELLEAFPEVTFRPDLPKELMHWLESIEESSQKLNPDNFVYA
ncbi:protein THEM6-like [Drosophila novamexicana]|uniref:protein THEM6-like n=1 Tax=Drosophila novamexicana TaxID=47314 RepID=UPI0011E5D4E3|nr:protein THEM6-like [Drosophila novamexicana]